jgi:rhodanese-related sulfurtransferase
MLHKEEFRMFARSSQRSTDPDELARRADDHLILDVREPGEWQAGHIDGSVHIPMGELGDRLGEIPADAPVITVCRSGRRTGQVAKALTQRGATTLRTSTADCRYGSIVDCP